MSDTSWHFLSNQFETGTRGSFKRCNILNNDHQSKLTAAQADPDIAALVARTAPLSTAFSTAYSTWISAKASHKGHTQLTDSLVTQLTGKIKEWDIQIQGEHLEGTPQYSMILPNRRIPFQQGAKDDRLSQVEALAERLLDYPALSATQTEVDGFATAMRTARDNQQQKEQLVSMASDVLEQARRALCTMMYGNLGVLMDKYRETPEMIENFWQLDLIRRTGQDGDNDNDDDLPDTAVTITGRVVSMNGNVGLANAPVRAYGPAGPGSGAIEVFTDMDGHYVIEVEDVPEPITVTIEASAPNHMMQSRNLNIEPGQDYEGEDFMLTPMA